MVYVSDTRGTLPSIYHFNGEKTVRFNKYEYVYSWRTGKGRKGRTAIDVPPPINKGSDLVGSIRRRKSFYQDLDATLGSSLNNEPPVRCLVGDEGHSFIKASLTTSPGTLVTQHLPRRPQLTTFACLGKFVIPDYVSTPGLRPGDRGAPQREISPPPWTTVRSRINSSFADMNPGGPSVKIGETLVELVSGNIPKVLASLPKVIAKQKSLHKALGDEYLSVQFGWVPIVNDIMSLVKTLMVVDSMVYTGSDRRQRGLKPDVAYTDRYDPTGLSWTVPQWRDGGLSPLPMGGGSTSPASSMSTTLRSDHRISARFTALARPTRGSNSFVDKAEDVVRELGIWYPALGWDLLPYSFLVDWFVNLGDSITNAYAFSSKGQTNIDYAYLTSRYTTVGTTTFAKPVWRDGNSIYTVSKNATSVSDVKVRQAISPFGLGIDLSALNGFQWSILVALGLGRGK